jgi:hypothetical protein
MLHISASHLPLYFLSESVRADYLVDFSLFPPPSRSFRFLAAARRSRGALEPWRDTLSVFLMRTRMKSLVCSLLIALIVPWRLWSLDVC